MDVLNSVLQQISQLRALIRNASRLRTVCAADHLHIAKHHFRVADKIGVHTDTVFICCEMNPLRLNVDQTVSLLQEDDIRCDFRACCILERVVWQSDRPKQVSSLGDILTDCRVFLVHRSL